MTKTVLAAFGQPDRVVGHRDTGGRQDFLELDHQVGGDRHVGQDAGAAVGLGDDGGDDLDRIVVVDETFDEAAVGGQDCLLGVGGQALEGVDVGHQSANLDRSTAAESRAAVRRMVRICSISGSE